MRSFHAESDLLIIDHWMYARRCLVDLHEGYQ
jgi:hypothetical protein